MRPGKKRTVCHSCYHATWRKTVGKESFKRTQKQWRNSEQGKLSQAKFFASPKGKALRHRHNTSEKTRFYNSFIQYKKFLETGSWKIAKGVAVPGDEIETQRRLQLQRITNKRANKKFRERWGRPEANFAHRFRREMILVGEIKEEEHPL